MSFVMQFHRLALVSAALAACEPPTKVPDVTARLAAAHAWSRGEVEIVSGALRDAAGPLPAVLVGAHSLAVRRTSDSTLAAALPDTSGPVTLRLVLPHGTLALGPVRVAGFRDAYQGPLLSGYVLPWPAQNPVGVLAAGDSGAVLVDLRFNIIARQLPESLHSPGCAWGVGASALAGHAVLYGRRGAGSCGPLVSYHLGPAVVPGDTFAGFPGTWVLGEIGVRRSVTASDSWLFLKNCEAAPCQTRDLFNSGGVTGLALSPRGDRIAFDNGGGYPAMVLDPRDLTAAFTLPRLRYAGGSAFSENGDTLWVAGPDSLYERRVALALDATTGNVLAETRLDALIPSPGMAVRAVATDPDGPWLYVSVAATFAPDALHLVLVLDRRTLAVRGVLTAPRSDGPILDFERIVPLPGGGVVYVVATAQGYDVRGQRARIYRYDRVPT